MDDEDDDSRSPNNRGKGIVFHKEKHNFAINISKGGGIGIGVVGVGIVLVGGAFLVNFFLNKKPTNKKHLQDHSSSSPENTDNGTEKTIGSGVSREISAHKLFEDGDHTFESNNGDEDRLKCDDGDQGITSFSENSGNQVMECNGSVVETDKLPLSAITDPMLHQPTTEEADVKLVSCIEVNGGSIDDCDRGKDSKADTPKHGEENSTSNAEIVEENVCRHSEGSVNIKDETNATFEADQGDEDKINIAIQTSEGKGTEGENQLETPCPQYDGLIDGARGEIDLQDSNNGLLTTSDARVLDENELLEEPKSGEEPETPELEEKEAEFEVETYAETKGIEENTAQDSALYNTTGEVVDEEETQLDVYTNVGEAAETDSSIEQTSKLIDYRVIKEAIEDTNEMEIQHEVLREAAEIDASIEHTSELVKCQAIEEAIEDKEAQHDVHINAVQEATEIDSSIEHTTELVECQVIEEAIEDKEHDVHLNAAGEAVEINSGSNKSSELIEIQTIPNQLITADNILPRENDHNTSSSESSILLELNLTTGLIIDSKDVGIDLHSIEPVTEKDIIYQETKSSQERLANPIPGENIEGGSQTLTADNVDEISDGSLLQAKDQTEKLQDNKEHVTLPKTEKEIHYKEIEDDDAISSENIQTVNIEKGVSNTNFFKKYTVKSTQQKNDDEKTSLSMIKRGPIVIGTMSALLRPVLYSCLIAVLAMVLYKIQGF